MECGFVWGGVGEGGGVGERGGGDVGAMGGRWWMELKCLIDR